MRFDVNLSILFPELPLLARPRAAREAGFDAAELWWPFDRDSPSPAAIDALVDAVGSAGLAVVSINLSHGDRNAGEHGLLAVPGSESRFRDSVDAAVEVAARLGCAAFSALYGNMTDGIPRAVGRATAIDNLAYAARRAASVGTRVVIEALNPVDFPRYGLQRTLDALELLDAAEGQAGVQAALLFDVYHVQRAEGDLIARIEAHAHRFGHVQVADPPGRFRPGTGEVAFDRIFGALERSGYSGFVGLEYRPSADPEDTFSWLPVELRSSGAARAT